MNNQTRGRRKTTSQTEEIVKTIAVWLLRKAHHNWVASHKIQMHSFLKVECLGGTRCRKCWNQFERIRFTESTLRHASIREKEGPSLGKYKSKILISEVDRSHEVTERQERCVEARLGILLKHIQDQRNREGCIVLVLGKVCTPGCINRRVEGKRVCS